MKKKNLLFSAFILTITSLLLRFVGMFFRIFISNRIGAEGMGLHQLIYSVYMLAVNVATSGVSMAVTRLVAEELGKGTKASILKIFHKSVGFSAVMGISAMAALYFGADIVSSFWLRDPRTSLSLKILAPSLPFIAISACLKGYFTAQEKVVKTAGAQIFEQAVRMVFIYEILGWFLPMGIEFACAAVMAGSTISEAASCLYLYLLYLRDKKKLPNTRYGLYPTEKGILGKILSICMPIAFRSYFRSGLHSFENTLIPSGLKKHGASGQASLEQYGMLKGMAMPILFFPSSFLTSFSTLLVSELSTANAKGQHERVNETISRVIQLTLVFSVFAAGVFLFFSQELGILIYKERAVGSMIRILAPLVPFMYLESIVDGMLTALNQQVSAMKYNMIDSVLRVVLIFLLLPLYGMGGFLAVMFVSNLFTSVMCTWRLVKVTQLDLRLSDWVIKPSLAAALAGMIVLLLQKAAPWMASLSFLSLGASAGIMGILYLFLLLLLGCVSREDALWMKNTVRRKAS